jgi:hypothetical protein
LDAAQAFGTSLGGELRCSAPARLWNWTKGRSKTAFVFFSKRGGGGALAGGHGLGLLVCFALRLDGGSAALFVYGVRERGRNSVELIQNVSGHFKAENAVTGLADADRLSASDLPHHYGL